MNRFARSCSLLAVVVVAAFGSGQAYAVAPTVAVDSTYGDPVTHAATLGRVEKRKLDVRGLDADSKRRLSLIGNNGWEDPGDAGPVQCEFVTVRRLTARGEIDKSFARNGVFSFPKAGVSVCAGALKIDSRDRTIGTARIVYKKGRRERVVFRLNTRGELDKSFGDGGIVRLGSGNWGSPGGWGGTGEPMLVKGNKLVLVTYEEMRLDFVRLREDGRIDRAYGSNGHAVVNGIGNAIFERDQRNRVYIAGFSGYANKTFGGKRAVVRRMTSDGKLDRSYGRGGTSVVSRSNGVRQQVVWIDEINVLADGRSYINGRAQGDGPPEDDKWQWALLSSSGKRETRWSTKSLLADGTHFSVDKNTRAATFLSKRRDTDGNEYNDEGRELSIGVAASGFVGETISAPVDILSGGELSWFGLGSGGHDIYTVTIFGEAFADTLSTDKIRVQRIKLDW